MQTPQTIGIALLNLGGPEHLEDVQPFLCNLFSDRQIIRLGPALLQPLIAKMIARRRAPHSMANYARIGGGSPIRQRTEEQARALTRALVEDGSYIVVPCMRYWHPRAEAALTQLRQAQVREIIALPLYPHYSMATTGSSLTDLETTIVRSGLAQVPLRVIRSWPTQPEYITCLVRRILDGVRSFAPAPVQVVYSAHSLPVQFIREGDPYVEHLQQTIEALEVQTKITGRLCYQSRSGPVEWLGPSLPETIAALAAEGARNLLVVPLSFVSDHVETLYEIDIQYREYAQSLGVTLCSTPALNADPTFIAGLRQLVLHAQKTGTE